jgi:valacyclovir hydrolase
MCQASFFRGVFCLFTFLEESFMSYIYVSSKSIHYELVGKGEALLLLQGNTASSVIFRDTGDVQYFSKNHSVFLLDFNGTGKSSRQAIWPVDWYAQAAGEAYEVLKRNSIEKVKLIGSSGGALIGFWLAIFHPELVSSLVADSFNLDYANQMPDVLRNTRRNYSEGQIGFWQHCHGADWQQVIEADTDFISRYAQSQTGKQVDIPVEKIQCPVLITGSEKDDLIPNIKAQANITAARIKQAEVYLHDSGTHPFMWSEPDAFRKRVNIFWK